MNAILSHEIDNMRMHLDLPLFKCLVAGLEDLGVQSLLVKAFLKLLGAAGGVGQLVCHGVRCGQHVVQHQVQPCALRSAVITRSVELFAKLCSRRLTNSTKNNKDKRTENSLTR